MGPFLILAAAAGGAVAGTVLGVLVVTVITVFG